MTTPIDLIKRDIGERHLQQLRDLDLIKDTFEAIPADYDYNELAQWTKDSETQISKGKANSVYGGQIGSPIDFNNAFVAFMESATMYLRDTFSVVRAGKISRSRSKSDMELGLNLLERSTTQIDKIAAMWGMDFIQICDFVTRHPDGHSWIVGPFCGAFIPKDFSTSNTPYIGIAFKGTNVTSEIINDLSAMSTIYASGRLWGSQVSSGFYYPVFTTYDQTPANLPFLMIQHAVQIIAASGIATPIVHVTGHSLGGAYSSLSFAQLCIEGFGTRNASLGDLYTFGCPRVGRGDFAQPLRTTVRPPGSNGSAWRIVNNRDYVPEVPASPPWPLSRDPFIHIDAAYKIYGNKIPEALPSEIGKNPYWSIPTAISPHYTSEYYKSLTYATTGKPPPNSVALSGPWPATSGFYNAKEIQILSTNVSTCEISLEANKGHIVGTIKYDCFVGEITALGLIGKLDRKVEFYYNAESWKDFYSAKPTQCLFTQKDSQTLEIGFIVDRVQVACARVPTAECGIGDVLPTRGSCYWSFADNTKVEEVLTRLGRPVGS